MKIFVVLFSVCLCANAQAITGDPEAKQAINLLKRTSGEFAFLLKLAFAENGVLDAKADKPLVFFLTNVLNSTTHTFGKNIPVRKSSVRPGVEEVSQHVMNILNILKKSNFSYLSVISALNVQLYNDVVTFLSIIVNGFDPSVKPFPFKTIDYSGLKAKPMSISDYEKLVASRNALTTIGQSIISDHEEAGTKSHFEPIQASRMQLPAIGLKTILQKVGADMTKLPDTFDESVKNFGEATTNAVLRIYKSGVSPVELRSKIVSVHLMSLTTVVNELSLIALAAKA